MPQDTEFDLLDVKVRISRDAARDVALTLHRLFPPGSAVTWQHNGQRCDGIVTAFSGPGFGARLQVHLGRAGRIVSVRPSAILRAAALIEGCALTASPADLIGEDPAYIAESEGGTA